MVVLHGLETSHHSFDLLEECWRVLGPGGKVLFIVPNRAGVWARRDGTPFGYGRPYSVGQLEAELRRHQFVPERHVGALYQLPSGKRIWMKSAPMFERIGGYMPAMVAGGVVMVEATKQVYPPKGTVARQRRAINVLEGLGTPAVEPT